MNAAGVTHYSPFFATSEESLEKVMQTNLIGTMLGCKAIGRAMMGNSNGGTCFLCSLRGFVPSWA